MNAQSLVSVIVYNYRGLDRLERCILSIQESNYPRMEILVVDALTSGIEEWIKSKFRDVELLHFDRDDGIPARKMYEHLFTPALWGPVIQRKRDNSISSRPHNIFGPYGTRRSGHEKAPSAICRKVAEAADGGEMKVRGTATKLARSSYIDEFPEGVRRLIESDFSKAQVHGHEPLAAYAVE